MSVAWLRLPSSSPHPDPPSQGGRGFLHAPPHRLRHSLPPCRGGLGWGAPPASSPLPLAPPPSPPRLTASARSPRVSPPYPTPRCASPCAPCPAVSRRANDARPWRRPAASASRPAPEARRRAVAA